MAMILPKFNGPNNRYLAQKGADTKRAKSVKVTLPSIPIPDADDKLFCAMVNRLRKKVTAERRALASQRRVK